MHSLGINEHLWKFTRVLLVASIRAVPRSLNFFAGLFVCLSWLLSIRDRGLIYSTLLLPYPMYQMYSTCLIYVSSSISALTLLGGWLLLLPTHRVQMRIMRTEPHIIRNEETEISHIHVALKFQNTEANPNIQSEAFDENTNLLIECKMKCISLFN